MERQATGAAEAKAQPDTVRITQLLEHIQLEQSPLSLTVGTADHLRKPALGVYLSIHGLDCTQFVYMTAGDARRVADVLRSAADHFDAAAAKAGEQ